MGPRRPLFTRRRSRLRRLLVPLLLAGLLLAPSLVSGGTEVAGGVRERASTAVTGASTDDPRGEAGTPAFARYGDLTLSLLSDRPVLVGYHEASYPEALALEPVGRPLGNDNPTRFSAPAAGPGPEYRILSSRGRPQPPTSAVDVVLEEGEPVRSPVDGVVTGVRRYRLYGSYPDTRIEIRPAQRPDLRVVLIHVEDLRVAAGDTVRAGRSVLAGTANRFPFSSHIDRYLAQPHPHVHLEIKSVRR